MPKLLIKEGPGKGDAFEISSPRLSIGREAQNSIRLADSTVSRYQARILTREGECYVEDLDSRNGTLVNGERVQRQELHHMDEIRVGNLVLIFLEDEVTDIDLLVRAEEHDPEITQSIDLTETLASGGVTEGSRRELISSNQRLRALSQLAKRTASVRSLPSLFDLAIDSINETLRPDHAVPIIRQEDGTLLPYIRARSGFGRGLEGAGISRRLVEHCLQKEVAALSRHPAASDRDRDEAVGSAMCAPLLGEELHGVLYCDRLEGTEPYRRADLQHLGSVTAQVGVAIENIRAYEDVASRARSLEQEIEGQYNLVGQSPQIKAVFDFIRKAAPTDAGVLICGESGTGKELVARAIHFHSRRSDGPFEAVNCAAMSESLVESELFGHVKGAYTGATNDRPGRFELAHGGTLFLDEVGALPLKCQTKLLRVLEIGTLRRVGDVKDRRVDVRVIAATNEDLEEARREGRFRQDLFFRLDVLRADLPPLRQRGDDIELLAQHFLAQLREKTGRDVRGFEPEVMESFRRYRWPGNVRELKNIVEHMVIMCEGQVLGADLLPEPVLEAQGAEGSEEGSPRQLPALDKVEKRHILKVLRSTGGNKKRAAEILGVDRSTLYAKLKRWEKQEE